MDELLFVSYKQTYHASAVCFFPTLPDKITPVKTNTAPTKLLRLNGS